VTIGMPVFNMEGTVQEAIDTILGQTFSDFELIISDNASEDRTGEICREAAASDPRVRYHRNAQNVLAENFRLVVLLGKGEYFMWAAADDSRMPEMVEKCVAPLEADPDVVMAYPHVQILNDETGERFPYNDPYRLDQDDPGDRYLALIGSLDLGNAIYGLYRRRVLHEIPVLSRISARFIPFSDSVFLTNLVLSGKVVQVPETLFIRRRGRARSWVENLSFIEPVLNANPLTTGVTLPVSESIQEHVRYVLLSDLSTEIKLRLVQATYEIFARRHGQMLMLEIDRAVSLARQGRFMETWNGAPEPNPDPQTQHAIEQIYAGLLLERLGRTASFFKHPGVYAGMAYCLVKLGRRDEAELQLAQAKALVAATPPGAGR